MHLKCQKAKSSSRSLYLLCIYLHYIVKHLLTPDHDNAGQEGLGNSGLCQSGVEVGAPHQPSTPTLANNVFMYIPLCTRAMSSRNRISAKPFSSPVKESVMLRNIRIRIRISSFYEYKDILGI